MDRQRVNLISWNINGCGSPVKRKKILAFLKIKKADIAFLQETHFKDEKEALKLRGGWVGHVFHNSVSSKRSGVAILVRKKINFVLMNQHKDKEGRLLCLEAKLNDVKIVLCNVYAPNKEEPEFFHEVNKTLTNLEGYVILGGDFNQTMDGILDRSQNNIRAIPRDRAAIHTLKDDNGLTDIWRLVNPREREYTFLSNCHKTFSRIDYFLISKSLTDCVADCIIGVIGLTDHAHVELKLELKGDYKKRGRWRLNTFMLEDKVFIDSLQDDIKMFFELNIGSTQRLATVWDASKAFIRGKCIAYASRKKKESVKKMKLLEKQISDLERELVQGFSDSKFKQLCQLKFDLHELFNKKAEYALFRLKTKYYESGEKAGKLLARQIKQHEASHIIPAIKEGNKVFTSNKEINRVFNQFYSKLYTSESYHSPKELKDFLTNVTLPTLTPEERDSIDAPITREEVRTIIMSLKSGKSPGSDGFPAEYYKKFVDELTPVLTDVYSEVLVSDMLPDSFNEALISLIPKPGRDTMDPANYRPIVY